MDLVSLAEKYENKEFLIGDPSWFMHQVEGEANKELLAFIASCLSYGSRKQFMPRIQYILDSAQGDVEGWLKSGRYAQDIRPDDACFYRLYTNRMMHDMLRALSEMLNIHGSMRGYVKSLPHRGERLSAIEVIMSLCEWFAAHGSRGIVPKDATSSCKRICMFLRWMVRSGSPVDIGIWADLIDRRTLIIPMDTHVIQEARRLGLLSSSTASMRSAQKLTDRLRDFFPDDPLKGDFALFGVGVSGSGQGLP